MKLGNRLIAVATALTATLGITTTAASADAAPTYTPAAVSCTSPSHNANGEGAGYMLVTRDLKVAPYADCGDVDTLEVGTLVYFHCYHFNSHDNLWWWVRRAGTSTHGWMSDDNLRRASTDENGNGIYNEYRSC